MEHSAGFLRLVGDAKRRIREIDADTVRSWQAEGRTFAFVDVREDREWQAGRLPGATHLGRGVLERDVERIHPDPTLPIVLYCGGGYRSALAADALQALGYTNVYSLAGGYKGWGDPKDESPRRV